MVNRVDKYDEEKKQCKLFEMMLSKDEEVRIIIVGDKSTGKNTFMNTWINGKFTEESKFSGDIVDKVRVFLLTERRLSDCPQSLFTKNCERLLYCWCICEC